MEDFLNKLYSYEYFGTYLMISIIVLVLLFIIILFFGKKDQHKREVEETKKLQKINSEDAFKEESISNTVEVANTLENTQNEEPKEIKNEPTNLVDNNLDNTIIVPNIENLEINEDLTDLVNEPIVEEVSNMNTLEEDKSNDIESLNIPSFDVLPDPVLNNNNNNNNNNVNNFNEPLLTKEEERPIVFDSFDKKEEVPVVPEFNFNEVIKEAKQVNEKEVTKAPEVFSSVFVEEKKEEPINNNEDDDLDIELPTLKKDVLVKEEDNIELPSLNDLSGETYNINK